MIIASDLQCSGRVIRIQSGRCHGAFSHKYCISSGYDHRFSWFYAWNRRQCSGGKNLGRRKKGTGESILFHADLQHAYNRWNPDRIRHVAFCTPNHAVLQELVLFLMEDCVIYGAILLAGSVPFMLQVSFQNFFVVNEKPILGLVLSIASGVTNMALDYVFIAVLKMGVAGAALATVMGYVVGGGIPLIIFCKKKGAWTSARKTQILRKTASSGCFQWLFGTDEQYFRVLNWYFVQHSADGR